MINLMNWNVENICGYKPKTTFYLEFSMADETKDLNQIKKTFNKIFDLFKGYFDLLTELVMVLNWKIWEHYGDNESMARLYDELWRKTENYAYENLKGDELNYFIRTID